MIEHRALAALALMLLVAVAPAPATSSPVEQQGAQVLELLASGSEDALRSALPDLLDPAVLAMAPLGFHVEQFLGMSRELGTFERVETRSDGPERADFILRREDGSERLLHLEVHALAPHRLVGIGLSHFDRADELGAFDDLAGLDAELTRLASRRTFAGVVLVSRGSEPAWIRAYGRTGLAGSPDNTPTTRFDLGSITKDFTALAVLSLAETGKLSLDDPLGKHLSGFRPEIAQGVRIRHLLRMESGFGDYFGGDFEERRASLDSLDDYVALFHTYDLAFEPGTQRLYSNVGYVLLGAIVEKVSGQPFAEFVRRRLFQPADMSTASFRGAVPSGPDLALGLSSLGEDGTNRDLLEPKGTPAGGIVASAPELDRFYRALRAGRLLDAERTHFFLTRFGDLDSVDGRRGVAGGAPGVSAVCIEDPRQDLRVIVLANRDEPIAEHIGQRLFAVLD